MSSSNLLGIYNQIPSVVTDSLEKQLKCRIYYISQINWVSLSSSTGVNCSENRCVFVLSEDSIFILDENFEKTLMNVKYGAIKRVLVDIHHEQCFQLHVDFSQFPTDFTAIQASLKRNLSKSSDFGTTAPALFALGRATLLNHLRKCWKSRWMFTNLEVADLPMFKSDILKLQKQTRILSLKAATKAEQTNMVQAYEQLKHGKSEIRIERTEMVSSINTIRSNGNIPPASDIFAVGGQNLWKKKGMCSYLINDMVFYIDVNFDRVSSEHEGKFEYRNDTNIRIEISVSNRMEHAQIKQLGLRTELKSYAESIMNSVVLKNLEMHREETNQFVVLASRPYVRRSNTELAQFGETSNLYSRFDGWQLQIRTIHRDILVVVLRESFLPPVCSHFRDFYVILYGGDTDWLPMASRKQNDVGLLEIIGEIVDTSRTARQFKQATIKPIVQSCLDSLNFHSYAEYTHFATVFKSIPSYLIFSIPFFSSYLYHLKLKSSKDERIIDDFHKNYFTATIKGLIGKKELIEQLNEKLSPFEMVEKFLQRSMLTNNLEVRMNWLQKLSFMMGFCLTGILHPKMVYSKILFSFFDDEDYFGRVLSFLLFMKEKGDDPVLYQSPNRFGMTVNMQLPNQNPTAFSMLACFTQANPKKIEAGGAAGGNSAAGANRSQSSSIHSFIYDLQNFIEEPKNYEFHQEVLLAVFENNSFFKLIFESNHQSIGKDICSYILQPEFMDLPLQLACIRSIGSYLRSEKISEGLMQIFKELLVLLVQLCAKQDRTLMKETYKAINTMMTVPTKLLPQLELLKNGGPAILVRGLDVIDLDQIAIIISLIIGLKNSLDLFIKIGLTQKILSIIQAFEEIEGIEFNEETLLQLEDLLLMIVKKQQFSMIPPQQKKVIFNLLKSTTSSSPQHFIKVMKLITEIFKKDAFLKRSMSGYVVSKLVNLIFSIDKKSKYEEVFTHALDMMLSLAIENKLVRNKLQRDYAFKGIVSTKRNAIPNKEAVVFESTNGLILALWDELYAATNQTNPPTERSDSHPTSLNQIENQHSAKVIQGEPQKLADVVKTIDSEDEDGNVVSKKNKNLDENNESQESIDSIDLVDNNKDILVGHSSEALSPLDDDEDDNPSPMAAHKLSSSQKFEIGIKVLGQFKH